MLMDIETGGSDDVQNTTEMITEIEETKTEMITEIEETGSVNVQNTVDGVVKEENGKIKRGIRKMWISSKNKPKTPLSERIKAETAFAQTLIKPKQALQTLEEMHFSYTEHTKEDIGNGFACTLEIDAQQFFGKGRTKKAAMKEAANAALSIIISKKYKEVQGKYVKIKANCKKLRTITPNEKTVDETTAAVKTTDELAVSGKSDGQISSEKTDEAALDEKSDYNTTLDSNKNIRVAIDNALELDFPWEKAFTYALNKLQNYVTETRKEQASKEGVLPEEKHIEEDDFGNSCEGDNIRGD